MRLAELRGYLFPHAAPIDEAFRQDLLVLANRGLLLVGVLGMGASALMLLIHLAFIGFDGGQGPRYATDLLISGLGLAALVASRVAWLYDHCRKIAWGVLTVGTAALIESSLLLYRTPHRGEDFVPGQVALIQLVAVAAIPFEPWQLLGLGLAQIAVYLSLTMSASATYLPEVTLDPSYLFFMIMLTLLTTVLCAAIYRQRMDYHRTQIQMLHAANDLREAQGRLAISENAASMGRLAAALSHELNSPVGAMMSSIDTLLLLASRQATSAPEQQAKLVRLQADLRRNIQESAKRLQQIATRMGRFTNLDQAEVKPVNLNDLVEDVAALIPPASRDKVRIELHLGALPEMVCHPQQMSAVFYDLVTNAIAASETGGTVSIHTSVNGADMEVSVCDSGHGISDGEIASIFDPGFKVAQGRVSTGNWSMFNARQIVRGHRGEIRIVSEPGRGTRVTVTLPVTAAADF
ncbi:MAG: HAMP domain-containing histidine kinase [Acidobacteria bacterium]|nr:HAMP domain-containing histidine kinase [Acidobacteriota bacterium]